MAANFYVDETNIIQKDQEKITPLSKLLSRSKLDNSESKSKVSSIGSKYNVSTRLGDQRSGAVDFKTDTLLEDHGISKSILKFEGTLTPRLFNKTSPTKKQTVSVESPMEIKKMNSNKINKRKEKKASPSLSGILPFLSTDELSSVTDQLKVIQETQDAILESLRNDIELIQTENLVLRQNNGRLQGQVSQMNQLVADLSFDLRQMRDIISAKQALGISLPLADRNDNRRNSGRDRNRTIHNKNRVNLNEEEAESVNSPARLCVSPPTDITLAQRPHKGKPVEELEERRLESKKHKGHSKIKNGVNVPANDTRAIGGNMSKQRKKLTDIESRKSNEKTRTCFGGLFKSKKKRRIESDQE